MFLKKAKLFLSSTVQEYSMVSEIKLGFSKQAGLFQSLSSCEICHNYYKQHSVKLT